ncbi:hypothetical protein GCM10026915_05150 [Simiduia litorea]
MFIERHPDTAQTAPTPITQATELSIQGAYLVTLLGCGTCHTDGALTGNANSKFLLAGSNTGIATSNPLKSAKPGIVFPPNLTPDPTTGLGNWSETDIVLMLRAGEDRHGIRQSAVMPWAAYAQLSDQDARAIAHYLKRLAPVQHQVPTRVREGQASDKPHVYFGVYQKP